MEKRHLKLRANDEAELENLLRMGSLPVKMIKRVMALLELDRGKSFGAVAQTLAVCYQSVSLWCSRYKTEGLSMLWDAHGSGRPVEIDGEQRAKITALACSKPPEGYARWSLRLLADKVVELGYYEHLSHNEAGKILKKMS
jgi:hypothetical protein